MLYFNDNLFSILTHRARIKKPDFLLRLTRYKFVSIYYIIMGEKGSCN